MSYLDQYSICPCGSGKKIKFCKCSEHVAEMDAIYRMIDGKQHVAALDRINNDLKTMPSEPWLLSMKCELLLQMMEWESLEETSAKFIRLQPDNPLAKLFRSFLAIAHQNTEEATSLLLQAVADSNGSPHQMAILVVMNLMEALTRQGNYLSALLIADSLVGINEDLDQVTGEAMDRLKIGRAHV